MTDSPSLEYRFPTIKQTAELMNKKGKWKVFLVDDERLALKRLHRLLESTGKVEIVGSSTDPEEAVRVLSHEQIDVIFMDIQMPGMNGFEVLALLPNHPFVVFTTAYDQYALRAFDVNSIDYLLKPIESSDLDRALRKVERFANTSQAPEWRNAIEELAISLRDRPDFPTRIASRSGDRTQFVSLAEVTHFMAEEGGIYAITPSRKYPVDYTISELERKLNPRWFVRIHRAVLLNSKHVKEVYQWFAGRVLVRLNDGKDTELAVARDRVRVLKDHLAL